MPTARWSPRSLLRLGRWEASLCLPRTRFLSRTSSNMEPDHCLPNTSLHKWEDRGKHRVFLHTPRSRRPPRHKGRPTRRQLCRFHFIVNVLIINRPCTGLMVMMVMLNAAGTARIRSRSSDGVRPARHQRGRLQEDQVRSPGEQDLSHCCLALDLLDFS